ncbi:MAG: hybrid sensor histidine kinase/response regulator, partial [Rhodanobacter sp.]
MTTPVLISILGASWLDSGPASVSVVVEVLAGLLTLTALMTLAVLRMVFLQRQKLLEANEQLQRQTAATQAQLDAIPFPIMLKDMTGAYRMLNSACQLRLGIDTV